MDIKLEKIEDFVNNYCKNTPEILEKMKSVGLKEWDDTTKDYPYFYIDEDGVVLGRSSAPTEAMIKAYDLGFEFGLDDIR